MGSDEKNRYLRLLSVEKESDIFRKIQNLTSDRDERDHIIRSSILDMHLAMEFELKRFYYHHMHALIGIPGDAERNETAEDKLQKTIDKLSFSSVYRVLRPIFESWPFESLRDIDAINDVRNQLAHRAEPQKVDYKGRSPFNDLDCFAQIYFDVWAITQQIHKLFERVITMPREELKHYRKLYPDERW